MLKTLAPVDHSREIGPRVVGGRYRDGYWQDEYTVLAIATDVPVWGWSMAVKWSDGHVTQHCTAWDTRRDRVLA
jgi:hypothetical protein